MSEPYPIHPAPKSVSIIIPNFNYERYLDNCIASAVGQTVPCEVIVVDDGSTDGSAEVLARWEHRVRVIRQPNQGQVAAYNTGFTASTGDLIVFLDSDDALEPHAIATLLAILRPEALKAHFRLRLIDAGGVPLGPTIPHRMADGDCRDQLLKHGVLPSSAPGSGNAYRRQILTKLFPLPTDPVDRHGADFFCCYGALAIGPVQAIDQILGSYRVHRPVETSQGQPRQSLLFGNAEHQTTLPSRLDRRSDRLRTLLTGLGLTVTPRPLRDFSIQKFLFAAAMVAEPPGRARARAARREGPDLWRTLWARREASLAFKLGLTAWAGLLLVLPRRLAQVVALKVCNPAAR